MSTTRFISGFLLLSTFLGLCGCSGLGGFGRQDYASLGADPFLDCAPESRAGSHSENSATSGFARLDDLRNSSDTAVATIRNTSSSGPSLSDFIGQGPGTGTANSPNANAVVTAAAESFDAAQNQATDSVGAIDDDFLEWANNRNNSVQQASAQIQNNVRSTVQTADHRVRQAASEIHSSMSEFPVAVADAHVSAGKFFDEEIAEPLVKRLPNPTSIGTRIAAEDPFAEFERQQQSSRRITPAAPVKTVASAPTEQTRRTQPAATSRTTKAAKTEQRFMGDGGWRPANLEFP